MKLHTVNMLVSRILVILSLFIFIVEDVTGNEEENLFSDNEYTDASRGSGQSALMSSENCGEW